MGLFGKKKKGTPPPCCGRTPETAVRVGADKTAASVKVLGSGCARCSALEAAVRAALAELGVDAAIEHVTDFMQIAAYGVMTTPALVVGGRVVSCGCVAPGDAPGGPGKRNAGTGPCGVIYWPQYHNGKEAGTNGPITEPNAQTGPQQGGLPDPRGRDDQRISGGGAGGAGVFPDVDRLPGDLRPPARHCHGAVPGGGDGRFTAGRPGWGRLTPRAAGPAWAFCSSCSTPGTACCSRPIRTGRGRGSISACPPGRMRRGTCWTPVRGRASGWGSGPASRRRISGG